MSLVLVATKSAKRAGESKAEVYAAVKGASGMFIPEKVRKLITDQADMIAEQAEIIVTLAGMVEQMKEGA